MYVSPNYTTKKQLREALLAGHQVRVFSPGPFPAKTDGPEFIEGPHYPKPHKWYAQVEVSGGYVTKVLT